MSKEKMTGLSFRVSEVDAGRLSPCDVQASASVDRSIRWNVLAGG